MGNSDVHYSRGISEYEIKYPKDGFLITYINNVIPRISTLFDIVS